MRRCLALMNVLVPRYQNCRPLQCVRLPIQQGVLDNRESACGSPYHLSIMRAGQGLRGLQESKGGGSTVHFHVGPICAKQVGGNTGVVAEVPGRRLFKRQGVNPPVEVPLGLNPRLSTMCTTSTMSTSFTTKQLTVFRPVE